MIRKIENLTHDKIKELIKHGYFNVKTPKGYIYMAGGILSKVEGEKHFISIKNEWVEV